jgi:hypothetical protein
MNIDRFVTRLLPAALVAAAFAGFVFTGLVAAQSAPKATAPAADLNQLMRGLFFPNANVVFSTQIHDPAEIKMTLEPSASTDPLTSVFGNWEAVQNSALVLSDAADLLMTPGRKCSNGRDVPLAKADWAQFVNELREAGMVAYKAAQSKDKDNMIKASDVLNTSCQDCHGKYRPRASAGRCQ